MTRPTNCFLNRIQPPVVAVYHDELGFIGSANEYEFNDLRIQIKKHKEEGYFVRVVDTSQGFNAIGEDAYYIAKDGGVPDWPDDLFPLIEEQLQQLMW